MIKRFVKSVIGSLGMEVSLKKNLWYADAWKVQKLLLGNKTKPIIFDVGACDGGTVREYKDLFPDAVIHAFEPQPEPFKNLNRMVSAYKDVYTNNIALAGAPGMAEFIITSGYASSSLLPAVPSGSFIDNYTQKEQVIEVTLNTLDDYTLTKGVQYIDILKMDVQGSELNVLKGAQSLLQNNKIGIIYSEVWFKTVYQGQAYFEDIAQFLRKYQFNTLGIYNMHRDLSNNGQSLWADAIFIKS